MTVMEVSYTSSAANTENETSFYSSPMENGTRGNQTATPTTNQSFKEDAYLHVIGEYIFLVSSPIITILGVVGNFLTLVIMTRKSFRSTSVAVYLSALATSHSLVLILDVLNNWVPAVPKINLLGISNGFCKFFRFFFTVVFTYSAWIVTSVCIERFIVVWFPFKAKQICSYRNTVITVLVMPVPICALYLYNLWAWYSDGSECIMVSSWYRFRSDVGPWINGIAYSYFPVIIMVILNAAIIGKLSLARSRRRQMSIDANANEKRETRITMTIVLICIFYVIMTVPLSIYYTLAYKYGQFTSANPKFYLVRSIVNMVSMSSYDTTFFLYVLTSDAFRKQLRELLCCWCQRQPTGAAGSRRTGFSGVVTGGGRAAGDSNISIAISSNSNATGMTDVTEDGMSVDTTSKPNASTTSEMQDFKSSQEAKPV